MINTMPVETTSIRNLPAQTPKSGSGAASIHPAPQPGQPDLYPAFRNLVLAAFLGSLVLLGLTYCVSLGMFTPTLLLLMTAILGLAFVTFCRAVNSLQGWFLEESGTQAAFLESLGGKSLTLAIVGSAALSLFLELSVIRWQGTIFEFFAFYKNYGLLSCFAGLGLGYALSRNKDGIPLILSVPLLGWQFVLLLVLRFSFNTPPGLIEIPFREQLNMGLNPNPGVSAGIIHLLLIVVFVLTALAFLPVGQLCGKLLEQTGRLSAYGMNLLGSLIGVAMMFVVSYFWLPPVAWFGLSFFAVLLFLRRSSRTQLVALCAVALSLLALLWPVKPLWNKVYSPYQLLEIGYARNGLMIIRAAGHYYQRVHNLSDEAVSATKDSDLTVTRDYYNLPYKFHPAPNNVVIVGAGSGNDVAAALRSGARHVDAIEIDPAILQAGKANHPERPYDDPRVNPVVNDARSFFRTTPNQYDLDCLWPARLAYVAEPSIQCAVGFVRLYSGRASRSSHASEARWCALPFV